MTNAPEKIWTGTGLYYTYVEDWSEGWWHNNDDQGGVEYTRTDLHLALVAAAKREARKEALREAADIAERWGDPDIQIEILDLMEDTGDE